MNDQPKVSKGFLEEPAKRRWHLLIRHDRCYGYPYVIAERNQWNRELKQPRVVERQQLGRLLPTNEIQVCEAFRKRFPQFSAWTEFYFWDHCLVTRAQYLQLNPEAPKEWSDLEKEKAEAEAKAKALEERKAKGEAIEDEKELDKFAVLNCGVAWAAWEALVQTGMLADLLAVLGAEDGLLVAQLAVYVLDDGIAMQSFEDWARRTGIPKLKPVAGQRISELLSRVQRSHIDSYFHRRFDALKAKATAAAGARHDAPNAPALLLAFDSTSISTYSETIAAAEYGHAKQDASLKQVNFVLVCDEMTGEALYADSYEGSINDKSAFVPILKHMQANGFDLRRIMLITDRGYKSAYNTQYLLDEGVHFVQGCPIDEKSIKRLMRKHRAELTNMAKLDPKTGLIAYTPTAEDEQESWRTAAGANVRVYLHLFFNPEQKARAARHLAAEVEQVLAIKNKNPGATVPLELWNRTSDFVLKGTAKDKDGTAHPFWGRNEAKINQALEFEGCLALRTSDPMNPREALVLYSDRNIIESDFRIMKVDNECNRLQCTKTAYVGKLFLYVLAQSLRRVLGVHARRYAEANPKWRMPGNSLDKVFERVRSVHACRQGKSRLWRVESLTKTQRDAFQAMGVPLPVGQHRLGC